MTPTPLNPTIAAINNQVLAYTPAVIAGAQAAEASGASGADKQQAVVSAVLGGTQALEAAPNPNVAAVAGLVNLTVAILNALGVFKKKPAA